MEREIESFNKEIKAELLDTSRLKDNVFFTLINAEQNKELLKTVPHREFEDLAIVYRWNLGNDSLGTYTNLVDNDLAKKECLTENDLYNAANKNTKEYFPEAKERYFWATQDCMSLDKRPYIGPYSKNTPDLFVATGFGKWGMTGSMLSAMILSDLVQEKNNEYSTVFSPSRNMLKPQLISNLGHALVGIGRVGGKRCSHMGCVLQWNKEEQTWECPCHGSRFSADGKVLDNPACDGLKKKHKK